MAPVLLDLDEQACRDPLVSGAKAARLAMARTIGLPVPPGAVVPVAAARKAMREAFALLQVPSTGGGRHAARLRVMDAGVAPPLEAALRQRGERLGQRLVVRSSSPLEGSGTWSGAFASYLGVDPGELPTAVAGCWASALGRDALERAAHLGLDPARLALAVLVQPQIDPLVSGTAEVVADGTVIVTGVRGAPAPLLSGWSPGVTWRVRAGAILDGGSGRDSPADWLDAATALRVGELAGAVAAGLGDDTIEWAAAGGEPLLLQSARRRPSTRPAIVTGPALPPGALRVARLVHRYGGPTGEALVLPWALAPGATGEGPGILPTACHDPAAAWAEARLLAAELAGAAWQAPPGEALAHAAATLAELRGPAPAQALERVERLALVHPARAGRALALAGAVAQALAGSGRLERATDLWRLTPEQVQALLTATAEAAPAPAGMGARLADRWEPLLHAAVLAHGERVHGEPAAPGIAAGPAHLVGDPSQPPPLPLPHRAVCVTRRPLPHLAPLLWASSALVTFGGSASAHLVHVARSLGLPAVVGCRDLEGRLALGGDRACLMAVDGDAGLAAVMPADATAEARAGALPGSR